MEKGTINLIVCAIIALVILSSCGHRTTSTGKTQIKTDSLNIENKRVLSQNITWSDIGSIKPFDALKPMLIDGKEYFNVSIQFDKSIKKGIEIKAGENLSYTNSENSEIKRNTEKTDYSNSIIGVVFVLALFLFLYIYLKNWKP